MADVSWLIRRLRAMSIPEVLWRLSQKSIQKQEDKRFNGFRIDVTSEVFNERLFSLTAYPERLHINLENKAFALNTAIHLLSGANYKEYKDKWNAGFQTENAWPNTFSYKLEYKQRDDIGDARTNWELNRHFQFALLAKDYAASGDTKYLVELESLFKDWNSKNPFLHGISWTSVMEVAIRCSNWCYAYGFLVHTKAPNDFLEQFRIGIFMYRKKLINLFQLSVRLRLFQHAFDFLQRKRLQNIIECPRFDRFDRRRNGIEPADNHHQRLDRHGGQVAQIL